jgi:hypothetical protein
MPSNEYHFLSRWDVEGTPQEVYEILDDAPSLVRWWPSVYLDVRQEDAGDARGLGKVFALHTRGWLPYTLRWRFQVVDKQPFSRLALEAWGDLEGRGVWTFEPQVDRVAIVYDWRVRADKPLLRLLSPLFKPILSANHRWAMARGEESLRLELARRHARTEEERSRIPDPPPPASLFSLRNRSRS